MPPKPPGTLSMPQRRSFSITVSSHETEIWTLARVRFLTVRHRVVSTYEGNFSMKSDDPLFDAYGATLAESD